MYTVSLSKTLRALANWSAISLRGYRSTKLESAICTVGSHSPLPSLRSVRAAARPGADSSYRGVSIQPKWRNQGPGSSRFVRAGRRPLARAGAQIVRPAVHAHRPVPMLRRAECHRGVYGSGRWKPTAKRLGDENAAAPVVVSFPLRVSPLCELARLSRERRGGGRCTSARSTTSPPVSRQASATVTCASLHPFGSPAHRARAVTPRCSESAATICGSAPPVVKPKNAGTDVIERGDFWGRSVAPC